MSALLGSKPNSPNRRTGVTAAAFLLLAAQAASGADADGARALLGAMHDATRQLNYDGVFVYQSGDHLDSMRLVHAWDGSTEKERLISLSGPAREVIRDGNLVTCLFADDQAAMVEKSPPRDLIGIGLSAPLDSLAGTYVFSFAGTDRVAGRAARIVAVSPQSPDRYGYRLSIDTQTKLLLKSVIVGRNGQVLEHVQFTHIEVLPTIPPALLEPEIGGSGFTWRTDTGDNGDADAGPETAWGVQWVPPGFALKDNKIQNMATSDMPVGHLVYSDGLAMVSVFIEKLMPDANPLSGYSARGAVNAFSRVADNHQITVVGELPLPTVRQIASSVHRIGN